MVTIGSELQRAMAWLAASRDVGASSKAIMIKMLGGEPDILDYPHDPDDLGRCLRLLARMPEWRRTITKMAECGYVWAALVRYWDELEKLFIAECGSLTPKHGTMAALTYDLMKKAEEEGLCADPRVTIHRLADGRICHWERHPA